MANGEKSRRRASAFQNINNLQSFENALDDWRQQIGVDRLKVDLVNEQRFDDFNFANEIENFRREQAIRAYDHAQNIFGLNMFAVDQEVAYQQSEIYDNANARLQELAYLQQDADFQFAKDSINSAFESANNSLALKINAEETISRNRQFGADIRSQSIQQSATKAKARHDILKQSLQTDAATAQASAAGRRGQSARLMEQAIDATAAVDQAALYSQLDRGEKAFSNTTSALVDKKKSDDFISERTRDKLLNDKDKIAQLFGLTVEQYEADTEKLGRMMIDTYAGIDTQLDRLAQEEFKTKIDLFAKMPLPPRFGPRAKPPRTIPYGKFAKPTKPVFYDHRIQASAPKQKKRSGFGSFLSIAGMAAAAVGTVLTAGAALPTAAPFLGIQNAGVWGAGLTGGGSLLQGLGNDPMMYN